MISLSINKLASLLADHGPLREMAGRVAESRFPVEAEGLAGALLPLVAERVSAGCSALLVVPTEAEAREMVEDLAVFQPQGGREVVLFPDWGTLPYGDGRPLASVGGERASALARLLFGEPLLVVAGLRALLHPLPPPAYLSGETLSLRVGQALEPRAWPSASSPWATCACRA